MIRGTSSLAWMLLAVAPCLARPCGAAHVRPPIALEWEPSAAAAQDPKPESDAKGIWTGKKRVDGKLVELPVASAKSLRQELAAIQVTIDVDRDLALAQQKLEVLRIVASRAGYAEREAVLVEVALALSSVLEAQGLKDGALAAASAPLLPTRSGTQAFELAPVPAGDLLALASAASDRRLEAVRTRLQRKSPETASATQDGVEQIVRNAVLQRQQQVLLDLGDRALPALEKLIAEDLEEFPMLELDPLVILAKINSPRCAEFLRLHFDRGGPIWKVRVSRLVKSHMPFSRSQWSVEGNRLRLNATTWVPLAERLLDDPSTARESLVVVRPLLELDALTKSLQRSIAALLCSPDESVATAAMGVVQSGSGRPTVQPVYEAALESPIAAVRDFGAQRLLEYADTSALLARAGSSDPAVRATVAAALRHHEVLEPLYTDTQGPSTRSRGTTPVVSDEQRNLLARMTQDPDPAVRAEAAESIVELPTPLESSVYERIAKDSNPLVRASVLNSASLPPDLRARCALELASDPDPGVLQSFDRFVYDMARQENATVDPRLFPALRARWKNPAQSFGSGWRDLTKALRNAMARTGPGTSELLRWSLAGFDPQAVHAVTSGLGAALEHRAGSTLRPAAQTWLARAQLDVTPQELADFLALAWGPGRPRELQKEMGMDWWPLLPAVLCNLDDDLSAAFLPLANDRKRDLTLRLAALQVAAGGPGPAVSTCLVALLTDAGWKSADLKDLERPAASIGAGLREEVAAETVAAVFASEPVPPLLASALLYGHATVRGLDPKLADRVLVLWFEESVGYYRTVQLALHQLASRPREARGDWLSRAMRDPGFWQLALTSIGDTRDPAYLGELDAILSGPDSSLPAGIPHDTLRFCALDALTRYFSDDAAEIILKTAGSTAESSLRDKCFAALDTIRKYQHEKGRWQDDRAAQQATDAAVRVLVEMLEDRSPEVRANAVRGLGGLRAVAELPRVVRMLKDSDDGVRKAASETLQKLSAPPEKQE